MESIQTPAEEAAASDRQPLNPLDRVLGRIDRSIRTMGYPGFETQMLVWLSGQVEAARLQRAIERLSRRRPVITARLVENGSHDTPDYWRLTHEAATLNEIEVGSADPVDVRARAEEILSIPKDPAVAPPLRFYLLRRRGAGDVLLLQFNHVLMGQSATLVLLREIDRLSQTTSNLDETPQPEPRRIVSRLLRNIPPANRRAAVQAGVELQGRTLRGRAALLGTGEEDKPRYVRLRIAARTADAEMTRAIHDASRLQCGLPSLSMSILACAFRAIRQLGDESRNATRNYVAGIGLDMNYRHEGRPLLQNLLSVVPVFAQPGELDDRAALIRLLTRQIRERLETKFDVATLRLANGFQRKPRHVQWAVEHFLRWTYSLWYAYFGSLSAVGRHFCDVAIENVQYVGPTWAPLGLSLLANQFQGRLNLQATYDPDLVDAPLAEAFLDFVVDDLARFAAV